MKKSQVEKLEDKDLQLMYFLGGLKDMINKENCHYWLCDIDCSCNIVPDDESLDAVKNFIKKHNITNERFIKLAYNFLIGAVMKYHGDYSQLFLELEEVLKPYQFTQSNEKKIPDNNFREEELEKLVNNAYEPGLFIYNFINKYNLTVEDFIILSKTILNYNFHGLSLSNLNDTFIIEIEDIINHYNLSIPKEYIQEYIKADEEKQETTKLIIETKTLQKKYLQLMKKLLIKDFDSATELITEELKELGFADKKNIKRLIKTKQKKHL